jgi:cytochrome b pre-mRNA-processing protein 3
MIFKKLLKHQDRSDTPECIAYEQIVAQARQEAFYASAGVQDTVDGRFDMIVLHAFLVMNRLNDENTAEAKEFSQNVFNVMFIDMDRSLREMGVGDISVGKKIKKMAQVFYGRVHAYEDALKRQGSEPDQLENVISRNIYPDIGGEAYAGKVAEYVVAASEHLAQQPLADILTGKVAYPKMRDFF